MTERIEKLDWYSADAATFGDRVAAARDVAGLSQKELAHKLGVKLKTFVSWEEDTGEPRANKLQMLAGVLNVSLVWLLTGEGDEILPPGPPNLDADLNSIMVELRQLREQAKLLGERIGTTEKHLRKLANSAT